MTDRWGRLVGGRGALACTLSLALLLGGCGSEPEPTSQRDIEVMAKAVFMSGDPEVCGDAYTQNALDQIQAVTHSSSPLASCEAQMEAEPWNVAKSVVLTELEVDGQAATVTVIPTGGEYDGSALPLRLVERAGWRIDHIGRLQIFNRERFLDGWLRDTRRNSRMTKSQSVCLNRWIRDNVSTGRFERTFTDPGARSYMARAASQCLGGGSDQRAIVAMFRHSLVRSYELSYAQADCVVAALESWLRRVPLERFYLVRRSPAFQAAMREAGRVCVGFDGPQGLRHGDA